MSQILLSVIYRTSLGDFLVIEVYRLIPFLGIKLKFFRAMNEGIAIQKNL